MDNKDELEKKAGAIGAQVLDGAAMAADDLEKTGVTAKDGEATEPQAATEEGTEPELAPETVEAKDKPDLQAMKASIEQLRKEQAEPVESEEVAQLRERVATLEATVSELKVQQETTTAAAKEYDGQVIAVKALTEQLVALRAEQSETLDVVAGLFDLVMGFQTGQKQVAIERNGDASVHDPAGLALQKQMEEVAAKAAANGNGEYAGEKLFPTAS